MRRPSSLAATPVRVAALLLGASVSVSACTAAAPDRDKDTGRPSAPTGVTAQAGSATSVHVMWQPASDDTAVTGYDVYERGRKVRSLPAARTMVDVDHLAPSTAYSFTVRARDAVGNVSAPSAPVPVTTPAPTPDDRTAPSRPSGLRGTADGSRAATLTWRPASDDRAVTAYDVYQEDSRIHSVAGTATTARLTGLRPGTVYTFTVRARDAAENSSPDSDAVDLTTAPAPGARPVTAPTDLAATALKGGEIRLTWTPPRTDGGAPVKEHQLYLNGRFATTIVWGAQPPPGTATYTFTVTDRPGTRYSVKLRAKLPDGTWGDFSAQRTVVVA
ncbi:fibronectin type III domain-containing protein [Streptomyces sp. NPDC045431]|uniref:fibronectin type III domain-containing protein n=1 Tax=Streptomyces sp. NPDC045431 TaxID=3155613 RepID=UPI00340F53D7